MVQRHFITFGLFLNPHPVLGNIRGVNDKEEAVGVHLINQKVVDNTTVSVAHHAIENLSYRHLTHIVREDMVHIAFCIGATDEHLTHVTDIKDTTSLTNGLMFIHNVGVLNRHFETSKGRNQCAQSHVFVIETSFFVFHFKFNKFIVY